MKDPSVTTMALGKNEVRQMAKTEPVPRNATFVAGDREGTWWFIPVSKWIITPVISEPCPYLAQL